MDTVSIIALTMGAAWASGINLYATIFMLGYLGSTGNIDLPPNLIVVTDPPDRAKGCMSTNKVRVCSHSLCSGVSVHRHEDGLLTID